jgi:hypothetical protein
MIPLDFAAAIVTQNHPSIFSLLAETPKFLLLLLPDSVLLGRFNSCVFKKIK